MNLNAPIKILGCCIHARYRGQAVMGPLTRNTWYCGLRMRRECRERFPRHRLVSDPGMHHVRYARAVMHVGIANPGRRGKRSRHSRRMRDPQCYVSGKRPMSRMCWLWDRTFVQWTWLVSRWCAKPQTPNTEYVRPQNIIISIKLW